MPMVFPTLDRRVLDATGTLSAWLVAEGVTVRAGQLVAEVQVGDASGQIAAPADGTLRRQVDEGENVRQGTVVAILG